MPNLKMILLIMFAGMLGTLCRYSATKLIAAHSAEFPFGTFAVNIAGTFLAGFIFSVVKNRMQGLEPWLPVMLIGFLGAFTTFSTFMLETANLAIAGAWGKAVINILVQNTTGILAAFAGIALGRLI